MATDEPGCFVELGSHIKTYFQIPALFTLTQTEDQFTVDIDRPSRVVIGARAWHLFPEQTIHIRPDPLDLLAAVSRFGSVLKTTSPERSYPTLRGHPPAIQVSTNRDIPSDLTVPDTDIELTVRPEFADICAVFPLAYYLPATVTDGDQFSIRCGGEKYVPEHDSVSEVAAAVLKLY